MDEGEGAVIQILVQPTNSKWASLGRSFIAKTKKNEANPEKASFKVDAKMLESVEQKISKPGFNVVIRLVVCAATKEAADAHLENLETSFHQYTNDHNHFSKVKHPFKKMFMLDFVYRYFPVINLPFFKQFGVLNSDELATIYHLPNKTIETPHIFGSTPNALRRRCRYQTRECLSAFQDFTVLIGGFISVTMIDEGIPIL